MSTSTFLLRVEIKDVAPLDISSHVLRSPLSAYPKMFKNVCSTSHAFFVVQIVVNFEKRSFFQCFKELFWLYTTVCLGIIWKHLRHLPCPQVWEMYKFYSKRPYLLLKAVNSDMDKKAHEKSVFEPPAIKNIKKANVLLQNQIVDGKWSGVNSLFWKLL